MVNYSNGKVYMIEPVCEKLAEGDIYIGSTCKDYLSQRMDSHRSDYKRHSNGLKCSRLTSFDLFDKYGYLNCKITLLETCPSNTKDELHRREAHYIRTLKCVNRCIPLRTDAEYYLDRIKEIKLYNIMRHSIKITCECGSVHGVEKTWRHVKTIKHLKFIANKINQTIVADDEIDLVVVVEID